MKVDWAVCAFGLVAASQTPLLPLDVSTLAVGRPAIVAELDAQRLKGEPRQLSWSPNGDELYVQVDKGTPSTVRHFIVTRMNGAVASVEYAPEWAASYWAGKSALAAPGFPDTKIQVLEDHQRTRPTPFSGGFANGGAQTVDRRNPVDTMGIDVRLQLLGQEVGFFANEVAMAGVTYGWAPPGTGAIAFVDEKGRLFLFDRDKHKQSIPNIKDARLPAWSSAGDSLAFVQRVRGGKYLLLIAAIARS